MFLLKKLNHNYKTASSKEGLIFSRNSIVHNIGFCTDKIKRKHVLEIAKEYEEMASFGFNNNDLGKYSKAMVSNDAKKEKFNRMLFVPDVQPNQNIQGYSEKQEQEKESMEGREAEGDNGVIDVDDLE